MTTHNTRDTVQALVDALDYILRDLELRARNGVVAIGHGAYTQGHAALAAGRALLAQPASDLHDGLDAAVDAALGKEKQ